MQTVPLKPENLILKQLEILNNNILVLLGGPRYRYLICILVQPIKAVGPGQVFSLYWDLSNPKIEWNE